MADHVIVGAGASGLYTAYRLLKDGGLAPGDTVKLYEWSQRPGGRIYTYEFPKDVGGDDGLYCEFGGMRFASDPKFPKAAFDGHRLVQNVILEMGLEGSVVPFGASEDRLYYLRGQHVYETELDVDSLPYHFNDEFRAFLEAARVPKPYTADNVIGAVASVFAPGLGEKNTDRPDWCRYFASGTVPEGAGTPAFPDGTPVRDIGYWNLLYDLLGDEGYDYAADANGYSSNVINWNAADAFENNNDVGSTTQHMRLDGGYSKLFEALAGKVTELAAGYPGSGIFYGQQLVELSESAGDSATACTFVDHGGSGSSHVVRADHLFLAMPRRSLELVAEGCSRDYLLNDANVRLYLESAINQPSVKAVLVFDEAWWTGKECQFQPRLEWPGTGTAPDVQQWVGGPSVTDLPLRMVDYFANNVPGGPGEKGGPYVLLASYDDMNYTSFWRELETSGDWETAPSLVRQPLHGPTRMPADSAFARTLVKQLAEVHGIDVDKVPTPTGVYFQDWGQDPFGAGYHGWASHYDICQVMDGVRAPYQRILDEPARKVYVIGSCYSFDQGWVEGAFSTAESVLQDFFDLPAFRGIDNYALICQTAKTGDGR